MSDSEATVSAIKGRRQFWIEQRDRARAIKNDRVAGEAQRMVDEYDVFIELVQSASGEPARTKYKQARR